MSRIQGGSQTLEFFAEVLHLSQIMHKKDWNEKGSKDVPGTHPDSSRYNEMRDGLGCPSRQFSTTRMENLTETRERDNTKQHQPGLDSSTKAQRQTSILSQSVLQLRELCVTSTGGWVTQDERNGLTYSTFAHQPPRLMIQQPVTSKVVQISVYLFILGQTAGFIKNLQGKSCIKLNKTY